MSGEKTPGIEAIYHRIAIPYILVSGPYYAFHIGAAVSSLAAVAAGLFSLGLNLIIGVLGFMLALLTSVALFFWLRHREYLRLLRKTRNPNAELMEQHIFHFVKNNHEFVHSIEFTIRSLIEGLDHYQVPFTWTGKGGVVIQKVDGAALEISDAVHRVGASQNFCFEPPLRKNEIRTFGAQLSLRDEDGTARPFLALGISHPITGKMSLCTKFDTARRPRRCQKLLYESIQAIAPRETHAVTPCDKTDTVSWKEVHPKIGRRYCIAWTF